MSGGATSHVSTEMLDRYAAVDGGLDEPDVWWAVEAHLETCAVCRDRLREAVVRVNPATTSLLERVRGGLAAELARSRGVPERRRWSRGWWATWASRALLPRLCVMVLVVLAAVGLDLADGGGWRAVPVAGVVAGADSSVAAGGGGLVAWAGSGVRAGSGERPGGAGPAAAAYRRRARRGDPRAGGGAGWLVGASPARWLLPCLAFTVGRAVAGRGGRPAPGGDRAGARLGGGRGVAEPGHRTAVGTAGRRERPAWAAVTAPVTVVLLVRRRVYTFRTEAVVRRWCSSSDSPVVSSSGLHGQSCGAAQAR